MSAMSPAGDGTIGPIGKVDMDNSVYLSKRALDTPEKRALPDGGDNYAALASIQINEKDDPIPGLEKANPEGDELRIRLESIREEPWAVGVAIGSKEPDAPRKTREENRINAKTNDTQPETTQWDAELSSFLKGIHIMKLPRSISEEFVVSSSCGDPSDDEKPDSIPQQQDTIEIPDEPYEYSSQHGSDEPSVPPSNNNNNGGGGAPSEDECSEVYRNLNYKEDLGAGGESPKTWPKANSETSKTRFSPFATLRKKFKIFGSSRPSNKQGRNNNNNEDSPVMTVVSSPADMQKQDQHHQYNNQSPFLAPAPDPPNNVTTAAKAGKKKPRLGVIHKWRRRFWGFSKKAEAKIGAHGSGQIGTESGKTYLDCLDELKTENEMTSIKDEEPPSELFYTPKRASQRASQIMFPAAQHDKMAGDFNRMRGGMSVETYAQVHSTRILDASNGDFVDPTQVEEKDILGTRHIADAGDESTPSEMFFNEFLNRLRKPTELIKRSASETSTQIFPPTPGYVSPPQEEISVRNSCSVGTWDGEPPADGFYAAESMSTSLQELSMPARGEEFNNFDDIFSTPASLAKMGLSFRPVHFPQPETCARNDRTETMCLSDSGSDSEATTSTCHSFLGNPCTEPYGHLSHELVRVPQPLATTRTCSSEQNLNLRAENADTGLTCHAAGSSMSQSSSSSESINDDFGGSTTMPKMSTDECLGMNPFLPTNLSRHQGGYLGRNASMGSYTEPLGMVCEPSQHCHRDTISPIMTQLSRGLLNVSTDSLDEEFSSVGSLDQRTSKLLTCPDILEIHSCEKDKSSAMHHHHKLSSVSDSSLASRLSAVSSNRTVQKFGQTLLEMIAAVNQKKFALEQKMATVEDHKTAPNCMDQGSSAIHMERSVRKSYTSIQMQTEDISEGFFEPLIQIPNFVESEAQTEEPFALINSCCSATAPKKLQVAGVVKCPRRARSKINRRQRTRERHAPFETRTTAPNDNAYDMLWYPVTLVAIAVVLPLVYAVRRNE